MERSPRAHSHHAETRVIARRSSELIPSSWLSTPTPSTLRSSGASALLPLAEPTLRTRHSSSPAAAEGGDVPLAKPLPPKHCLGIYIITALAVIGAYALLLMISIRYIKIVIIPVIILLFIGALWGKFWVKSRFQQYDNNGAAHCRSATKKSEMLFGLVVMVVLTYLLQLMQLMQLHYGIFGNDSVSAQQNNGSFIISHFLVFFSSAFGALAVMMSTIVTVGTSPSAAQVLGLRVLRRTFTAILLITVHTMATEWIGEDMLLVCMPELIAVLAWFTLQFMGSTGCSSTLSVDKITSRKSSVIIFSAAVALVACFTSMFASENKEILESWYTRALYSSTLSGVLSYFSVWMIHQWSESSNNRSARVPIQLLKFSAKICFAISAGIFVLSQVTLRFSVTVSSESWSTWLGQWVPDGRVVILFLTNQEVILYLAAICAVLFILCLYRSLLYSVIKNITTHGDHHTGTAEIKILVVSCMLVLVWQSLLHQVLMSS